MGLDYILFGNMCSGKSTVGQILKNELGFAVISAKDVIAKNIPSAPQDVQKLKTQGYLLPDDLITGWILKEVQSLLKNNLTIILDGFPRTPGQALKILKSVHPIKKLIYLEFAMEIIEKRFANRIMCARCDMPYSKIFQDFLHQCFYCQSTDFKPRPTDRTDYFKVKTKQYQETSLQVLPIFRGKDLEFSSLKDHKSFQELRKEVLDLFSI